MHRTARIAPAQRGVRGGSQGEGAIARHARRPLSAHAHALRSAAVQFEGDRGWRGCRLSWWSVEAGCVTRGCGAWARECDGVRSQANCSGVKDKLPYVDIHHFTEKIIRDGA